MWIPERETCEVRMACDCTREISASLITVGSVVVCDTHGSQRVTEIDPDGNDRITYAQFIRELQDLAAGAANRNGLSRMSWLQHLQDWAEQADIEARLGLPDAAGSPDAYTSGEQ